MPFRFGHLPVWSVADDAVHLWPTAAKPTWNEIEWKKMRHKKGIAECYSFLKCIYRLQPWNNLPYAWPFCVVEKTKRKRKKNASFCSRFMFSLLCCCCCWLALVIYVQINETTNKVWFYSDVKCEKDFWRIGIVGVGETENAQLLTANNNEIIVKIFSAIAQTGNLPFLATILNLERCPFDRSICWTEKCSSPEK